MDFQDKRSVHKAVLDAVGEFGASGVEIINSYITAIENQQGEPTLTLAGYIEKHGNELVKIGAIDSKIAAALGLPDTGVYTGMGYFVDHHFNHHPNIEPARYFTILTVLNDPTEVRHDTRASREGYIFIKQYDKFHSVIIDAKLQDGKLIIYKTFFSQKKKPYENLALVWP